MKDGRQTFLKKDGSRESITELSEIEILVFENIFQNKVSSVEEVHQTLPVSLDYLSVLRYVHGLLRKNLLVQMKVGNESIYKPKSSARYLQKYFRHVKELNSRKSVL
jgi:predicted transcriptional regulator